VLILTAVDIDVVIAFGSGTFKV